MRKSVQKCQTYPKILPSIWDIFALKKSFMSILCLNNVKKTALLVFDGFPKSYFVFTFFNIFFFKFWTSHLGNLTILNVVKNKTWENVNPIPNFIVQPNWDSRNMAIFYIKSGQTFQMVRRVG